MPNLLARFEADAAELLRLPPGQMPAEAIARYRRYRKRQEARLKMFHRAGASGRDYCLARAGLIDVLLRYLWEAARTTLSAQAQKEFPPLALVAIGGYGRGELNPFSDLDFMVLHEGQVVAGTRALPHLNRILEGVVMPLFDFGFKVGYSVRTVAEAVAEANKSMQSKTAFLEARLITGQEKLFAKFQKAVVSKCVEGREDAYLAARLEDQMERRRKYGDSATMQEPNVKNGCGGLRDYQNLRWMAFVKYRVRSLEEMEERLLISATERRQLAAAHDFLLRTRTELHYQANRAADVLARGLQPAVAHQLGYTDRSPARRLEQFMRALFVHMRHVYLISRTFEERLAALPSASPLASLGRLFREPLGRAPEPVVDGFKLTSTHVLPASPRVFHEQPNRMLRVFLHAQQRGLRLHPELLQLIRRNLALVDHRFLRDPHARETFMEILSQRGTVAPALRAMHEVGLLGKYVPEFGRLTCLVQHEFFHLYAADEHTLQCLEQLDRLWSAAEPSFDKYREIFQAVEQPALLHLALLLHDAGKARAPARHSTAGAHLAQRAARRLGLDAASTHTLCHLIEHHLTMAKVSQQHDLDDGAVIGRFARLVQTPQVLRLLTLLTVADTQGTSTRLWTGFKDSLLWTLYRKTEDVLAGGSAFRHLEQRQKELLADEVAALLPRGTGRDEIEAHFAHLPPRYFQIHTAGDIAADLTLAHRFLEHQAEDKADPLLPVTAWEDTPDRGCTVVKVITWDRPGLFSKIAGSFSACGLNILSAQVFTRGDGIVLDTFHVTDAYLGGPASREARHRFENVLRRALTEGLDFAPLLAAQKPARPLYQPVDGVNIPTRIHFDNTVSDTRTVLEIQTEDRVGLLHVLSRVLSECALDISLAKISTEKGAAIDTFYLAESDGRQITDPQRQACIAEQLCEGIARASGRSP
jgi:[protein-PII] uridylyltransferase